MKLLPEFYIDVREVRVTIEDVTYKNLSPQRFYFMANCFGWVRYGCSADNDSVTYVGSEMFAMVFGEEQSKKILEICKKRVSQIMKKVMSISLDNEE